MKSPTRGILFLTPLLVFGVLGALFASVGQIPVIDNPKTLPSGESGRHLVFKEELTIGNREGDESSAFGQRVYFNVDQAGNIYIVDWDRKRIQKFDSTGRFLFTIGRQGQGPGEFRNVWRPEFEPDGSFFVVDIAQKRISFFSPEGKYLRQIAFPRVAEMTNKDLIREAADAGLVVDPESYFFYREIRNLTAHTYDEAKAEKVIGTLNGFRKDVLGLLKELKRRNHATD
jgi:hypothetical protein